MKISEQKLDKLIDKYLSEDQKNINESPVSISAVKSISSINAQRVAQRVPQRFAQRRTRDKFVVNLNKSTEI